MRAKKHIINVNTFTKIEGYKRLIKCRGCGKKIFSKKNYYYYCKACSDKIKNK